MTRFSNVSKSLNERHSIYSALRRQYLLLIQVTHTEGMVCLGALSIMKTNFVL